MGRIIKRIPLWAKEPVFFFLKERGKLPGRLIACHVLRSFANNARVSVPFMEKVCKLQENVTYGYLEKKYRPLVLELMKDCQCGKRPNNPMIWVMWWQGEKKAPEIVRRCIASIRKNAGIFKVQMITSENYRDYVQVPNHIQEKLDKKIISFTHFSDYCRMALLSEYGGLWLDAATFVKEPLNAAILEQPIFSVCNPDDDHVNVSNWMWTVGAIGGWRSNGVFSLVKELLSAYWKEHDVLVDYFVFDYILRIVYDSCNAARDMIRAIEPNNESYYYYQKNLDLPFDEAVHRKESGNDTWLYKIAWQKPYLSKTADNRETLYAHWLKETDELL